MLGRKDDHLSESTSKSTGEKDDLVNELQSIVAKYFMATSNDSVSITQELVIFIVNRDQKVLERGIEIGKYSLSRLVADAVQKVNEGHPLPKEDVYKMVGGKAVKTMTGQEWYERLEKELKNAAIKHDISETSTITGEVVGLIMVEAAAKKAAGLDV